MCSSAQRLVSLASKTFGSFVFLFQTFGTIKEMAHYTSTFQESDSALLNYKLKKKINNTRARIVSRTAIQPQCFKLNFPPSDSFTKKKKKMFLHSDMHIN